MQGCSAQYVQSNEKLVTTQMFIDRRINKYMDIIVLAI